MLCAEGPEDSSSPEQWALTDVARLPQLATAERLARKHTLRIMYCKLCHVSLIQWNLTN